MIRAGQPSEKSLGPSLLKDEVIVELAKKYSATPGQILLSWGVQRGTSVIPKSENEDRLQNNFSVSPRGLTPVLTLAAH